MIEVSENKCHGGTQGVYRHRSRACSCDMTFGLFMPDPDFGEHVPVLWYLSGLTCTHENAMIKAGAQRWAAEHGIALVFPDTSPRGESVPDDDSHDLGQGAGFYLNATEAPWSSHFHMWDYVAHELNNLVCGEFPIDGDQQSIMGHSMGGHGALTLAMGLEGRFRSVSAFAPICNPTASEWGRRQLRAYLGDDESLWRKHDATFLMLEKGFDGPVLIDTGTEDQFFDRLGTDKFLEAVARRKQQVSFRLQAGYDHSYFFVSTFMEEHFDFHSEALGRQ
ncbi:MAG: S-formylglutathione hydrolase [Roseovarius sp.]|nr:S-formylglutathione hydrolase [Roseovarius sp.]